MLAYVDVMCSAAMAHSVETTTCVCLYRWETGAFSHALSSMLKASNANQTAWHNEKKAAIRRLRLSGMGGWRWAHPARHRRSPSA